MLTNKTLTFVGCLLMAGVLSSCSSDKVLPEGKRISVLTPTNSIKADAKQIANIKIPAQKNVSVWAQNDMNAQHLVPNIKASTDFQKQWDEDFGTGTSKREFLISRPLIADGSLYALDADGKLSAFNLSDGKRLWKTTLKPENKNIKDTALKGVGIATNNGIIYATTGYGDVYALNAKDGSTVWNKSFNLPLRIAPVYANNKLFIQSVDNKFFALDIKNGETLWQYDISSENTTIVGGATPAYSKDLDVVITGFSNGEIQTFNASLGVPLWSDIMVSNRLAYSTTYLSTIKASPIIEGDIAYILGNSNVLAAIDMRSGQRLWEKEIGGLNTPLLAGNTLYVVTNTNQLVALNKTDGEILWTTQIDLGGKASEVMVHAPLMINDKIIVTLSNGLVYSYKPTDGKQLSSINLKEKLNSAPISADGYIVFTTRDAELLVYK